MGVSDPNFSPDIAIEPALYRRLDLANSRDQVDDSERKVFVAADNLGAELNLIGSANVGSTVGAEFFRLEFGDGVYTAGFEAELPLDRRRERNAYRESLLVFQQRKRNYENAIDEVKLDVRDSYRQLSETAQRYEIRKNSLELSEKRVESTQMFLEAGQALIRDLLDAQNDLLVAQDSLTASLIDHLEARLNFYRDVGVLQVLPDGMWDKKTVTMSDGMVE